MNADELDDRLRALVASAVADAPAPKPLPAFDAAAVATTAVRPMVPRRRPGLVWAAVGVAAAAAVAAGLVWANRDDAHRIVAASTTSGAVTTSAAAEGPGWPPDIAVIVASDRGVELVTAENGEAVVTRVLEPNGMGGTSSRASQLPDGSWVVAYCCQEIAAPHIWRIAPDNTSTGIDEWGGDLQDVAIDGAVLYVEGRELVLWVDGVRTVLSTARVDDVVDPEFHLQSDWVFGAWDRSATEPSTVIVDRTGRPIDTGVALGSVATATGDGLQEADLHGNGELRVMDGKGVQKIVQVEPEGVISLDTAWPYALISYVDRPALLIDALTDTRYEVPIVNGIATISMRAPSTTAEPFASGAAAHILTAGPDGVWETTAAGLVQVTAEPMAFAVKAPDGSVIMQRKVGYGNEAWTPADTAPLIVREPGAALEPLPAFVFQSDKFVRVHDVATLNGHSTMLYSLESRLVTIESEPGVLAVMALDTGNVTVVSDQFGGWESGSSRMHLAETGIIVGEEYNSAERALAVYLVGGESTIDAWSLGLQPSYYDCSDCPRLYTISRDGSTIAWLDGTQLVQRQLNGAGPERVDLSELGLEATNLELGDGFVLIDRDYGVSAASPPLSIRWNDTDVESNELPGVAATLVTQPAIPWEIDVELTGALHGQTFATSGELVTAVETQIRLLKYEEPAESLQFRVDKAADGSVVIVAPNFDDSVPTTRYRIVLTTTEGGRSFVDRIDSVAVCRDDTYSTPQHLCV